MKKKLFVGTMLLVLSISFANAQDDSERRAMIRQAMPPAMGDVLIQRAGNVNAGVVRAIMVATGSARMMPAQMGFPTTGDAAKDAQIKALITEMNTKIQAIQTEYQGKLKAIIGDSALMPPGRASSTTPPGILRVREMREGMMGETDDQGSTTRRMNPAQGRENENRPMYIGERQNAGESGGAGGIGTQIGRFFKNLFGGGN